MNISQQALDTIDRRILRHLQQDARLSTADLAQKVGLSPSPVWRRVRALENAGVITGYRALVNPDSVGLHVSVFVHVSLEKQIEAALETFEAAVQRRPEVMECYLMTGDADYLLRVAVADLGAYERFLMDHLTRIRGIASIKSSFALRAVKHGTGLPLTEPEEAARPPAKRAARGLLQQSRHRR